ncbi:Phospholipase YtpA [Vibrio aerogenes CECT 7868]|uniref:Phospholipase YtpA n=1 Tax=Vibrio aerogenes CECT 7868 TaxID=1216006 RepID=A0A1M6AK89_9VIBR|nr:alpha/beta fold hydrolase [Vibrio aerogenes]SHI36892.1 Phospholipase YtpA [Vibrio aerogenes CECT 7868]
MNRHAMPPSSYTQESLFEQAINNDILTLWQKREEGKITAFDNKQIYWCRITHPKHKKMVFVLNGRGESALKYQEIFFDLYHQGYDVYSLDHRGQGLSDRLIDNRQIGYVSTYQDYILDISYVLEQFSHLEYQFRFLLAHSMGCAIAARYIQTCPHHQFHAIAMSAPMIGLNIPLHLRPVIRPLVRYLARRSGYAPGYADYENKPFENNPLTHSRVRYQWFRNLYEQNPEIQIGGPSSQWIWQTLIALEQCHQQIHKINLPTLILQAGKDTLVNNFSQNKFFHKLLRTNPESKFTVIPGARHELLFESDQYRNQALNEIIQFFETSIQEKLTVDSESNDAQSVPLSKRGNEQ